MARVERRGSLRHSHVYTLFTNSSGPIKTRVLHCAVHKFMRLKFSLGKVKRETMRPAVCFLRVREPRGSPCLFAGLFAIGLRFVFH